MLTVVRLCSYSIERCSDSAGADEVNGLAPGLLHTAKQASVKPGTFLLARAAGLLWQFAVGMD